MSGEIIFKKAKNAYLYTLNSEKYFDFRKNSNIIGFSNKKTTNILKNHISSSLSIRDNSIYHRRFRKFIDKIFLSEYDVFYNSSIEEFFFRLKNFNNLEKFGIDFKGDRIERYLKKINLQFENSERGRIVHYDMTEFYFDSQVVNFDSSRINILNYYYYPDFDFNTFSQDIIILPEFFSGEFQNIFVLVKKVMGKKLYFLNDINCLASINLIASMRFYWALKNILLNNKKLYFKLNWENIKQKGRIFIVEEDIDFIQNSLRKNKILINNSPPFYNYLPIILEDFQKNYLNRIKLYDGNDYKH